MNLYYTFNVILKPSFCFITEEERHAFANYISTSLKDDPDCKHLPINANTNALFTAISDGIILW